MKMTLIYTLVNMTTFLKVQNYIICKEHVIYIKKQQCYNSHIIFIYTAKETICLSYDNKETQDDIFNKIFLALRGIGSCDIVESHESKSS